MYWPGYPPTKNTTWYNSYDIARARDRLPKATMFGDKNQVLPTDMDQGTLGDCYFIASCAALAEWEPRVRKVFVTQTYTQEGIVVARGMQLGIQQDIYMDDFLPFKKNKTNLIFDELPTTNSLWGPFIEKLWAKVNGNYERLNGGGGAEVYQFLFGLPTTTYSRGTANWKTIDDIFAVVSQADA